MIRLAGFMITALAADTASIPVGTQIKIRTVNRIESRQSEVGQDYRCTVDAPVQIDGKNVVAKGADCILRIVETKKAGKLNGASELQLELTQVRAGKDLVSMNSDPAVIESAGKGKLTGIKTGVGAAAGAAIGGIFGGKGAVIGGGAGAGAGLATAALTHGPEIKVVPETVLTFVVR